ncbi:hypothetical protein ACEWPB_29320 (plasmid) [Priestia megaterium]|uniref:hypothetical protein n=1 Tax=Priestia megaterium TaxID=1404 RepID=UPI0035C9999B
MRKMYSLFSIVIMGLLAITTIGGSSAQASVPRYSFQTEDGKWDGEVGNPNNLANIEIDLVSPIYLKTTSGTTQLSNYNSLSVRLRNASTGATTSYHNFTNGKTLFTSMKTGKYYVDIKDSFTNGYVSGKLDVVFK